MCTQHIYQPGEVQLFWRINTLKASDDSQLTDSSAIKFKEEIPVLLVHLSSIYATMDSSEHLDPSCVDGLVDALQSSCI